MILDRYDALSLRERGLVLVAVLVVIYFLWTSIVSLPVADARQAAAEEQQRLSQRISQMALEEAALHQAAAEDPEQMLRRERDALRMELADLDEQLAELSLGLVSVHQLASVLEQVLVEAKGLQLRRLQTLPVESLNLSAAGSSTVASVYKHGVLLAVSGSYFDVLAYLKNLESLGWRFYWEELRYEQEQYPTGLFELKVFTLSTEEGLLGV